MRKHFTEGVIRHHECDAAGAMKLHCLLDRMQDAAAEHAALLDVGMEDLAEMHLIWVLSRLRIRLLEPLKLGALLRVVTYPTGVERIFAHRCYEIILDGRRAGVAGSFWLPVNTVTRRPVNAKKVLPAEILDAAGLEKFFPEMEKLPDCGGAEWEVRRVGAGDVDLNGHLNNAVYARWITDFLGDRLAVKAPRVREIQLNYLNAGQFGETVILSGTTDGGGGFALSGRKEDGTEVFQASGAAECFPEPSA